MAHHDEIWLFESIAKRDFLADLLTIIQKYKSIAREFIETYGSFPAKLQERPDLVRKVGMILAHWKHILDSCVELERLFPTAELEIAQRRTTTFTFILKGIIDLIGHKDFDVDLGPKALRQLAELRVLLADLEEDDPVNDEEPQ